jgi:hypothetical protein
MNENEALQIERLLFSRYNPGMPSRISLTCLLLIYLTACAPTTASPASLLTRTPELATLLAPTALPARTEASSPTPEIISPMPETTPTSSFEPTVAETLPPLPTLALPPMTMEATDIPQPTAGSGAIQFFGPGPLSKLVSPIYIYGYAIPGYNNKGYADLYGEDGRVLDSEMLQLNTAYTWAYFLWNLSFQVQGAGEFGRLTMSTQDEYGRLVAVYSVHLILLPEGNSIVNPPGDLKERCVVEQPIPGQRLSGGMLKITGEMRPFNTLPLVVNLITRDGNVIASQPVAVLPVADDSYVPFQINLPYKIPSGMWARLTVSQADDRISGLMYLYSREVFLYP